MEVKDHFHLAEVEKDKKTVQMLTEFENKLGEQIGGDVVLIAYKRDDVEGSTH
ncbi:MAG: hypothetical protein ACYCYE_00295 [Clostridia bacterium]